ncbi:GNAT family N-acetyltransferase [Kaistella carnis]|uniref:GNAT family N-acetyltransferase n=1 Tax=Kaistella carnis TaxID=1241979 RepID=A0A3G8XIX5_9FLAO|nr:GNAT family N-acetyltransferase [Kaistella carnis]AZI33340.1 GNAT family N-acetyltransferase [Kaistella carnis]
MRYFPLFSDSGFSISDVTKFNNSCFKIRQNHNEYDHFRFIDNPFSSIKSDFIYCVENDGKYIAQMLTMPAPLSLNEEVIPAFWGQDYYVLEEYRNKGIGKKLADYYLKNDYYIAVGFSEKSARIHQDRGAKVISHLNFYLKWGSIFHRLKFLTQRVFRMPPKDIKSYQFPDNIGRFQRIKDAAQLNLSTLNWNKNVIETLRDKRYFQWRFFYKPDRYFFYISSSSLDENPTYFVAKPYFYKGVNWLKIVDYRFNNHKINEFTAILMSAELLRKKLKLYGTIISSSQNITDQWLSEHFFTQFKHEVVLTTFPFNFKNTQETHDHLVMSFADSDLDMHSNLGKFNYAEDY